MKFAIRYRTFYIFRPIWIQYGINVHKNVLSDSGFCEARCSDSHTLLKGVNELILVLHTLLADLGEIRFKQSAHQVIEHLRISWKQAREDRTFLTGLNKVTFRHVPYFESKERLGNTCILRHGVHHLHSVQPSTTCSQPLVSLSEVTHLKYIFKLYIPLCRNVSQYTATNSYFLEAPVFNNLAFIYRFKLLQNVQIKSSTVS